MPIQTTDYFNSQVIEDLVDTGAGMLVPASLEVRLFVNNPEQSSRTQTGDLTEANFDGYAALTPLEWGEPYRVSNGDYSILSGTVQFLCTGDTVSENVVGYSVHKIASGSPLLFYETFESPKAMALADQSLAFVIEYKTGAGTDNGSATIVS